MGRPEGAECGLSRGCLSQGTAGQDRDACDCHDEAGQEPASHASVYNISSRPMRFRRSAALLFAFALAVNPADAAQAAKPAATAAPAEKLPPLSYTCPMHPEILEDKGGICPICKMDLVPIRLDSVWTCG